jgi:hypothetical protein
MDSVSPATEMLTTITFAADTSRKHTLAPTFKAPE